MPFAGLGLHVICAVLCAIHAIRSGQPLYWLFILFAFPLLGSLVYVFAVYLPNSRVERGAHRALASAMRAMDPGREVREARAALDDAPTAQNQMRLAQALLAAGDAPAAAQEYETCLRGPFAQDVEIRFGAARAYVECQRYADALRHLEPLHVERPEYRSEAVALLRARSLAGLARSADAQAAFEAADAKFGTYETKAEFTIWAYAAGQLELAERLNDQLERTASKWSRLNRELNEPTLRRLAAARSLAGVS